MQWPQQEIKYSLTLYCQGVVTGEEKHGSSLEAVNSLAITKVT